MSSRIRMDDAGPGDTAPDDTTPTTPPEPPPRPAPEPELPREPVTEPEEGEEPGKAADPETSPEAIKKRFDRLTREKYEYQRRLEDLQQQFNQFQQRQQPQQPPDPTREAEQRGYQRAQYEAVERDFNQRCNDIYVKGREEYGEGMDEAVAALTAAGWNGNRPDALAALTQLPEAHRVYRELAGDLDNAARVLSLPPMQMAMELTRMATSNGAVRAEGNGESTTRAPAPIRTVGGNSGRREMSTDDPRMSMAEFIRRRDREERRSRILR